MLMGLSAFLAGSLALTGPIAWAEVAKRIPDRKDPTALVGGISFDIGNWTHIFRDPVLGNDSNNQMADVYGIKYTYKNTYMPANIITLGSTASLTEQFVYEVFQSSGVWPDVGNEQVTDPAKVSSEIKVLQPTTTASVTCIITAAEPMSKIATLSMLPISPWITPTEISPIVAQCFPPPPDPAKENPVYYLFARNWTHLEHAAPGLNWGGYGFDKPDASMGEDAMNWNFTFNSTHNKEVFTFEAADPSGAWGPEADTEGDNKAHPNATLSKMCTITASPPPTGSTPLSMTMLTAYPWFTPVTTGPITAFCT